jgi:DNA-binding HxlR family transcriptional regulator
VTVLSYSERVLFNDQQNYFIVFVADHRLNVVFSRVHMFQTYSDTTRYPKTKENPAEINHSRFWKLVPSSGMEFEPDHQNWLIADLESEIYKRPSVQRAGMNNAPDDDVRPGRAEGIPAKEVTSKRRISSSTARKASDESGIKHKLIILRELVDDGIIGEEDYDYKKAKLLREGMTDMSLKDQLRELKDLEFEGLITEEEYNEKKKELLEQF